MVWLAKKHRHYSYPTSGLVAHWPFIGNANDVSGNGHHGTVSGATLAANRFGQANCAYSFDHINDYISHAEPVIPAGAKTLVRWLNSSAAPSMALYDTNGSTAARNGTCLFITTGGKVRALITAAPSTSVLDITGTINLCDGNQRLLVFTWDGSTTANAGKLYVDGAVDAVGTATTTETSAGTNTLRVGTLGAPYSGVWPYGGAMEEGLIYNRALPADEIARMWRGRKK